MQSQKRSFSLEKIVKDLLAYFLDPTTGVAALTHAIKVLDEIYKAEFDYYMVSMPMHYLNGDLQVAQDIKKLQQHLMLLKNNATWSRADGISALMKINKFIENGSFIIGSINNNFIYALLKIENPNIKSLLAEKDGKVFRDELYVALNKQRAQASQTQAKVVEEDTAEQQLLESLADDQSAAVAKTQQLLQPEPRVEERVHFSGGAGELIISNPEEQKKAARVWAMLFSAAASSFAPFASFKQYTDYDTENDSEDGYDDRMQTPDHEQIDDAASWQLSGSTTGASATAATLPFYSPLHTKKAKTF